MRVQDLIDALESMDPNSEVVFSYSYGDYWSTVVAAPVESIEQGFVTYSAYHQQDKIVEMDDDEMDSDDRVRQVVVLG